jgi:hypothetical protein
MIKVIMISSNSFNNEREEQELHGREPGAMGKEQNPFQPSAP